MATIFLSYCRFRILGMDLLKPAPIPQVMESENRTHQISIPQYGYSRAISPALMSFASDFYDAFLHNHGVNFSAHCTHCNSTHGSALLCLPSNFSPFMVDFLLDLIERTPHSIIRPSRLLDVVRLCGFLLVKPLFVYVLTQVYIPSHFRHSSVFTRALVDELDSNGYHHLGQQFADVYF